MRFQTSLSATMIVAFTLGISACKDVTGPEESLSAARALWSQRAPASYTMTMHVSCECTRELTGPVVIAVKNGAVESRRYVHSGALVESRYDDWFPTVEQLFDTVERAIRENWSSYNAQYDSEIGYPTRVEFPGIAQAHVYTVTILHSR